MTSSDDITSWLLLCKVSLSSAYLRQLPYITSSNNAWLWLETCFYEFSWINFLLAMIYFVGLQSSLLHEHSKSLSYTVTWRVLQVVSLPRLSKVNSPFHEAQIIMQEACILNIKLEFFFNKIPSSIMHVQVKGVSRSRKWGPIKLL